jgi:hypothetical protein
MTNNHPSLENTRTQRGFWLMGTLVLILATLLPPRTFFYRLLIDTLNLKSLFPFLMHYYPMPGGLIGQLLYYTRLARANSAEAGDYLAALVASCLATLSLTLCLMFFWRFLVDRMPRPTLLRVLLTVLVSVGSSLVLTLILCYIEYVVAAAFVTKESQVFAIILVTFILFIVQLLFTPVLFMSGAILVKWQARA